ncbi:MAG: hypothetical protein PHQ35_03455 [Phycisphaerae bacterium]|nr:hypothetical protein [Phycisphaerae bacterium]MDD5380650.1 hypothetical protein [Phycisphaerae bacterium]
MKNAKTVMVIVMAAVLSLVLCGAAFPKKPDCKKTVETFLAGVLKGEIDKSYDEIIPESLKEAKPQEVQALKSQTKTTLDARGKLLGYEFVKQQQYGDCIVRLVYILKTEHMPITWEFYFYKASSDWILVNIKYSDEYDLLVDK